MGRPLRIILQMVTYHVYSRCIDTLPLMFDNSIKDLMIQVIKETQEKFDFDLISFIILDNHFHFIIKTTKNGETISKIIQRIKSVFAKRYNKIHGRKGPLWNERYGCKIVEHQRNPVDYLLYLLWYMAYNSLRKNLLDEPRSYKYSAINYYLIDNYKDKHGILITVHEYFLNLGKTFKQRLKRFLDYEKLYLDSR